MPTPREEREVVISYNEEEPEAKVWSASPLFHRKMEKLGIQPYETSKRDGTEESKYYRVPKRWVRIRPPRKQPELTDEQRQERATLARARFTKRPVSEMPLASPAGK